MVGLHDEWYLAEIRKLCEEGKFDDMGTCPVCGVQIRGDTVQETYFAQKEHYDRHNSMQIVLTAYDTINKTVKPEGNSGRVYIPRSWIGKRVKVVLLEPL